MFEQQLAQWWLFVSGYLAAPQPLFAGVIQPLTLIPAAGIACFIAGLVLAALWREKRTLVLLPLFVLAALAPVAIAFAHATLGWLGLGFAVLFGGFGLLLWVGLVATDATRRLPVWLLGLSLLSFVAYCSVVSVAMVWNG